jgi:hypothetical protein
MTEFVYNTIHKIQDVTPIPTEYNGNIFRSRLESRWAKFFDLFNIPYEYEQEGFQDGDKQYLPDFYLPTAWLRNFKQGVYVEIKPTDYNEKPDHYKWGVMSDKQFVVCYGNPPPGSGRNSESCIQFYPSWDNDMRLMKCISCGFTKFEFNENNYRNCKNQKHPYEEPGDHLIYDLTELFEDQHLFSDNRIFNYNSKSGVWK